MASRVEDSPAAAREEKAKSAGRRLLSRMKTVLRRTGPPKPSRQLSILPTSSAPTPASPTQNIDSSTSPVVVDTSRQSLVPTEPMTLPEVGDSASPFEAERILRSQIYADRLQQFPKSFGLLEMDPSEFYQTEGHVFRVSKSTRMRVHRQCHQCDSDLDKTGLCENCSHNYCRQCTRYPPKRTEAEKIANRERRAEILKERSANPKIWPEPNFDPKAPVVVRRPARPEQELVYKKIRQRVRRTCCQCLEAHGTEVIFHGGGRDCHKCQHVRCTDCPRDPPKKDKYPYGYPGDAFGAKSIPHCRCHECYAKFPPGADNGTVCLKCSHKKCDNCARMKPQKVEPGPDPDVVKSVQEKIAAMNIS